ncbi:uncharacterized protein LOC134242076 [Saccostrea cucullata]|uniref:uncharacterized protein LOC134242076 n=1 Tax=Saccostrea cuccullata TaxID=36930 RepID=UPI002ED2A52F
MYEKQKAETEDELSIMKGQYKSEIIQRIKDFKNRERETKTSHKDIREKMKKQALDFIDHISAILKEALNESSKDKRETLMEISQYTAEAERFEQNLDQLIEKFETLTESSHPADLILYRKRNSDTFKRLKFPEKINLTLPSFTIGQINKTQNKHQFGKFMRGQLSHLKSSDDSLRVYDQSRSSNVKPSIKKVSRRPVRINETKTQKRVLYHVSYRDDRSAYVSGDGPGIQLIHRSGTELDNISTDGEPFGLAVMRDGSLIYPDYSNQVIYRVSLNKQKTELINTGYGTKGLCCTRSGDILVCMDYVMLTRRVVKYSSNGWKIQEFHTDQNGESLFNGPRFVCENINEDICVSDSLNKVVNKVVVLNKSGNLRFKYDGKVPKQTLKKEFDPRGVATDSQGHILIADKANNAVHLISQDGDFLSYILTKDDGISRPWGISVDTSDNLWIVEGENACIKVFHYLSSL